MGETLLMSRAAAEPFAAKDAGIGFLQAELFEQSGGGGELAVSELI